MRLSRLLWLIVCLPLTLLGQAATNTTQLGVAHIGGLYSFSTTNYLKEGALAARAIGARCIKVSLSLDTDNPSPKLYPFHSQWPVTKTLEELAATPYYTALFAQDFDTFILTSFRPGRPASYWRDTFTPEDEQAEEDCYAALTRYFLKTYAQSRKTFIIQNWEGDWALRGSFDPATKPTPAATELLTIAQRFGCPYAVYWQMYCNEPLKPQPKVNADYKGFWLIRPDGSRSTVCQLFQK